MSFPSLTGWAPTHAVGEGIMTLIDTRTLVLEVLKAVPRTSNFIARFRASYSGVRGDLTLRDEAGQAVDICFSKLEEAAQAADRARYTDAAKHLIEAISRLALLLSDYFDKLRLEQAAGELWSELNDLGANLLPHLRPLREGLRQDKETPRA